MALTFKKIEIESFKFGDLEVAPQMGNEQKMRVRELKITEDGVDEATTVLSDCFGEHAAEVKTFMTENLTLTDLAKIQVYLTQGQAGLDLFNERMEKYMDKAMDKALAEKDQND